MQAGGHIAHLAHLGGMVCGLLYLRPEFIQFHLRPLLSRLKERWRRWRFRVIDGKRKDDDIWRH
nr:hypothetical protein [Deltaproteobacteria bacterium]